MHHNLINNAATFMFHGNGNSDSVRMSTERPQFKDSLICTSFDHCKTCRDREGGKEWRLSNVKLFEVPGNTVDFQCPYGVPWNMSDSWWMSFRKQHKLGTKIATLTKKVGIKPCGGCRKRKKYLDGES